ncbi:MAG: PQQ-dependent sugar dehydrogenase [Chitinophagales bacterium]|nr:PQQ-dependent sugar dehydrogenase [Chitinophagales bacterium]
MKKISLIVTLLFATAFLKAQTDHLPNLKLKTFSSGYNQPLGIENAGDDRLFIVERTGKIWVCNSSGKKSDAPFLNISDLITTDGDEQGLLGLAFDPNYAANGYFYVNYTNKDGNTRISRFSVKPNNPNQAKKQSELVLLKVKQPFINHNSGSIRFSEGYLYIPLGDGGDAADPLNNAQDPGILLGKVSRIDVTHGENGKNYSIPPTNPFIGVSGYLPEIWATGLRNPWRFSFDALTDDMWIGDVGQDDWEEIDFQPAGEGGLNYGWSCWEGSHFFKDDCNPNGTPPTFPIAEYEHIVSPGCGGTIIGGFVYRGANYPDMYGKYIYADYCTGIFRAVYQDKGVWVNRYISTEDPFEYTAFGTDVDDELYVTDYINGEILHVKDAAASKEPRSTKKLGQKSNTEQISLYPNPNAGQFTVELNALYNGNSFVTIFNQIGQQILSETKPLQQGINKFSFASEKLTQGIYILQIRASDGTINKRFSVQ